MDLDCGNTRSAEADNRWRESQSIGELWDRFLVGLLLSGRRGGFAFGCRAFCDGEGNENFRRTDFLRFAFSAGSGNWGQADLS